MYTLEQAASAVAIEYSKLEGGRQAASGGMWVSLILELLPVVLDAIAKCKAAKEVPDAAANPSVLERAFVNLKVRRELGQGPREFRKANGVKIVDAMFKTAASLKATEVEDLYSQL